MGWSSVSEQGTVGEVKDIDLDPTRCRDLGSASIQMKDLPSGPPAAPANYAVQPAIVSAAAAQGMFHGTPSPATYALPAGGLA